MSRSVAPAGLAVPALSALLCACPTRVSTPRQPPVVELPPRFFADPPFGVGFDCVVIGCDQERTLVVENRGGGVLKLASIRPRVDTSTDFFVRRADDEPLPTVDNQLALPAGGRLELVIRYRPSDGAPDNGAVVFTHYNGALAYEDSAPRTDEVPLTTRSLGTPAVGTVDEILDFGFVAVGDRRELRLVIENAGSDAVLVAGPLEREEGTAAVFRPPAPRDWGERFANPGEQLEIPVVFEPLSASAYFGALLLNTNDPDRPGLRIAVQGTAIADAKLSVVAPVDGLLVLPPVRINEVREGNIVVQNWGGTPLDVVGDIAIGAELGFSIAPVESVTLTPLASTTLTVSLRSENGGPVAGAARLRSNDPTQPEAFVELLGDVMSPMLAAEPAVLDFGEIVQGWTAAPQQFAISNIGYGELTVSSITLEVGSSQQIRLIDVPPLPQKLAPGEPPLVVTVIVDAINVGPANGVIAIGSDSIDGSVTRVDVRATIVTCEQGCPTPNGTPECSSGACRVGSCFEDFHDADFTHGNGCECQEDVVGNNVEDIGQACGQGLDLGSMSDESNDRFRSGTLHSLDDSDLFFYRATDDFQFLDDDYGARVTLVDAPPGLQICANFQPAGSGCGGAPTNCSTRELRGRDHRLGLDDSEDITIFVMWAPGSNPVCGTYTFKYEADGNF